jgi:hypothetical protein
MPFISYKRYIADIDFNDEKISATDIYINSMGSTSKEYIISYPTLTLTLSDNIDISQEE